MPFAENLKKLREGAGLSRNQIAKKLGMNPVAYGAYERGEREPNIEKMVKIAEALRVTTDCLLDFEVDRYGKTLQLLDGLGFQTRQVNGGVAVLRDSTKEHDGTQTLCFARYTNPEELCESVRRAKEKFEKQTRAELKAAIAEQFFDDLTTGKAFFVQGSVRGQGEADA